MSVVMTLARLGLALNGTNEDLELIPPENNSGSGDGEGDEGDDSEDSDDSDDGEGDESGADSDGDEDGDDDAKGSGSESGDDSDDEGDESGSGSESGEDGDDGDEEGDSEGSDSDGEDGDEEGNSTADGEGDDEGDEDGDADGDSDGNADGNGADGDSEGEPEESEGGKPEEVANDGAGNESGDEHADGASGASGGQEPEEAYVLAQELIDALETGAEDGLTDNNAALGSAIGEECDDNEVEVGEQVWRPYNPGMDSVKVVYGGDEARARALKNKVKKEISYLRSQLRNKFLQARSPRTVHGVRKGRELSERRLVSSVVELRSGRRPTRPDWMRENREDCSLAMAVVLDESGSMGRRLAAAAAAAALSIAVPLDELGAPCLVIGPRDAGTGYDYSSNEEPNATDADGNPRFHRFDGVTIDVFKDWDESMRRALPRFSRVQSSGGTPLSDGIQYAMQHISDRPERHRVIGVVTDGWPDNQRVVKRQIRIAREAGVHIVGIGISSGCEAVKDLFPTHVSVENLSDLPQRMLGVLNAIMFPKRGKRIALDGKFRSA